jgi:ribose 5-phosphate isomerase B
MAKQKFQIYLGADHGGFALKEELKTFLRRQGYIFHDLGNYVEDKDDDYPEFARRVAKSVQNEKGMGILICRSGTGVGIVANKFSGVRAVSAKSVKETEKARQDEDANVLAIGADYVSSRDAKKILKTFLLTQASRKPRHLRRRKEIEALEQSLQ